MLKKILGILAVLLTLSYIVFAIITYSDRDSDVRCKQVIVVVKDSTEHRFVRAAEIKSLLQNKKNKIVMVFSKLIIIDLDKQVTFRSRCCTPNSCKAPNPRSTFSGEFISQSIN